MISCRVSLVVVIVVAMFFECRSGNALTIRAPQGDVAFVTPVIRSIGNATFDAFNASLVIVDATGCSEDDVPSPGPSNTSTFVLFASIGGCYPDQKARAAEAAGYDGVIIVNDRGNLGVLEFYWHPKLVRSGIPALDILKEDAQLVAELGLPLSILVRDDDPSPWDSFPLGAFYPFSIVIGLMNTVIFVLVVVKAVGFYRASGFEISLATQLLAFESVACIIRFVYVIDPQSLHHLIPWGVHEALLTNTFTLSLVTNVLIMFYWHATLAKRDAGGPSLDRYKWPCYVFVIVFVVFDIVTSMMLGTMMLSSKIILLKGMVFIITGALTAVAFLVTGVRVVRTLKNSGAHAKGLRRLSSFIIATGVCLIWFTGVSLSVPFSFDTPISWFLINLLAYLATESISMLEVLSLRPRGSGESSRTATTKNTATDDVAMD